MAITTVFNPPLVSDDDATFDTKAFDTMGKYNPWSTEANALAVEVNDDATAAALSETNAASSAVAAQDAAASAEAIANYKGEWSALTGALSKPASVDHNSKTWRLENNLADVTLSEPGVTADWTDITSVKSDTDNTFTGVNTFSAAINEAGSTVTSTANSLVIDCSLGNKFTHVLTENTTLSFINPPANGVEYSFRLDIIQDAGASGFVLTLHSGVSWDNLTAPTLTSTADARDVLVFSTDDGFTTSDGFTPGQNMAVPA